MALWGAMLGFMLDAMDVMLYTLAIPALEAEFGFDHATAGLVSSATLAISAAGGIGAGLLADRIGRQRTLIYTILLYSFASGGTATATGLASLMFWRAVVGMGLGGEWSAGTVLVAESWPPESRGRAIGLMQSGFALGYMLAALVTAFVLPRFGWRVLFLVGVLPALLTMFVRRYVQEPEIWRRDSRPVRGRLMAILRPPYVRRTMTATALATVMQFAYWGLFSWLPGFLAAPPSKGGGGLDLVRTSLFVFLLQFGAFAGYLTFGWMADRFGRRPAFAIYALAATLLVPLYGSAPHWAGARASAVLLGLGPLIGFFGTGFFSLFGTMLSEIYPTALRGAGQGFVYNVGRSVSAPAPFLIGAAADRHGFAAALALTAAFFCFGAMLVWFLPETRRTELRTVA